MTEFAFMASGDDFNVDAFLRVSSLVPDRIGRRGEPKRARLPQFRYVNSWLTFVLGDGRDLTTCRQEEVTIDYIKANREGLRQLASFPGVTRFSLQLSQVISSKRNLCGFMNCTSQILMWHLLDVGCSLTFLNSLEWIDDED